MSNFSPLTFAAAVSVSGSGGGGGSGTSNYEALSNLPKINGVTLAGSKTSSDLKITSITSYTELSNTPSINGVALTGDKTTSDLKISGVTSYTELSNTPSINGVSLSGNKSSADLKITSITSYTELSDKPSIEGITLSGNKTLLELGIAGSKEVETRLAKFYPYLYTGRDLVEVFGVSTAVQAFARLKEKSDAGDFSGLGIGDYINIPSIVIDGNTIAYNSTYENLRAEIVAFDQYYRNGNIDITQHHIIMQFKNCPLTHRMNATDTNTGGWASSELKTYLSDTVAGAIENAIGISLKTILRMLSTHGSWAWLAEKCFLPSEVECTGTKAWSDNYGYTVGNCRQWAMFQLRPNRLIKFYNGERQWWWTCSDSTMYSTDFVGVHHHGYIHDNGASADRGVPFAFAI